MREVCVGRAWQAEREVYRKVLAEAWWFVNWCQDQGVVGPEDPERYVRTMSLIEEIRAVQEATPAELDDARNEERDVIFDLVLDWLSYEEVPYSPDLQGRQLGERAVMAYRLGIISGRLEALRRERERD